MSDGYGVSSQPYLACATWMDFHTREAAHGLVLLDLDGILGALTGKQYGTRAA